MKPQLMQILALAVLLVLQLTLLRPPQAAAIGHPHPLTTAPGRQQLNGQWSMFKYGAERTGRTELVGPQTAHVRWQHTVSSLGFQSAPVIGSDGSIYAGGVDGCFYAFNPDGTLKWKRRLSATQINASPAIGPDGSIYVVPENGELHALTPGGRVQWRFQLGDYSGPSSSPVVDSDGVIYLGASVFYAINPNGTLKWRYVPEYALDGPPAIGADGSVYVPAGYDLLALTPDGRLKWRFQGPVHYPFGGAPAIGADGTIYLNTYDGVLHAITADGKLAWTYATEGIVVDVPSSPAIGQDGTLYFGGGGEYQGVGGYVYALNPAGRLQWKFYAGCDQTAPSIGGDGTIYLGSNYCGVLYALNPDGTEKWSYVDELMYMRSAPAIGEGQRLYTGLLGGSTSGGLLAIGPSMPYPGPNP